MFIQRGADGHYRWDAAGLDPTKSYEYFYDVFRSMADAKTANPALALLRNSGYFWADASNPSSEMHWAYENIGAQALTIHRQQSYNAFGEVASEIDGRGNVTTLDYNTLGNLTRKQDPWVQVTRANGYQEWINPQTTYIYDRVGSVVAYRDPNGNLTTQAWTYGTAQPSITAEWHPDGGKKTYHYDVLGNRRVQVDELGRQTDYQYDKENRLVRIDRPVLDDGQRLWDAYEYDEQGQRIASSSALGRITVDYNARGEVTRTVTAAGRTTTYTQTWVEDGLGGHWVKVMRDANGRSTTDVVDAHGRTRSHTDLGNHVFVYQYNHAGLLARDGNTVYQYYGNGLLMRMTDTVSGIAGSYEYDRNGNRTFEGFTGKDGTWAFQQSVGTYDALNRLVRVQDPRYVIDYEYDANGNRIHMRSEYNDAMGGVRQVQDYWYQYDRMDRFTITMGTLSRRGTSATEYSSMAAGTEGVWLSYDQAGQRRSAAYGYDGHEERYTYDANGNLTETSIGNYEYIAEWGYWDWVATSFTRRTYSVGRVIEYIEYNVNEWDGYWTRHTTQDWDADNLLMSEHNHRTQEYTVNSRMADGTVQSTTTYKNYYLLGSRTTSTYTYEWFDSAKQTEIKVSAFDSSVKNWAPGFSRFVYDERGRLVLAYDQAGNRGFAYQVDGEGRILQRDELMGGTVDANGKVQNAQQNRFHSYYLFDDRQVGNIGNDGIDRIDYATELRNAEIARNASGNKDDSHKRFTPVAGADFDVNYQPINSLYPTAAPGSYIVRQGDTLQTIAAALWGDAALWYILADANGLAPNQPLIPNTTLKVPNKVTNIHNNASTFKPYDAGEAIGNVNPTIPDPPPPPNQGKGCGGVLQVVAIIVAIVVTIYTAGAAAGLMGAAGGFSGGLAVLGGTSGLSAGMSFAAAAIGGAVGSIASQGVMIAGGAQDKFDWKSVGLSALGAGVTVGLGASTPMGSVLNNAGSGFGRAVATGAANAAVTGSIGSALDLSSFSWKNVAVSAVGAGVAYGAGQLIGRAQYGDKWTSMSKDGSLQSVARDDWGRTAVRGFGSEVAAGAASAAARGNLSSATLTQIGLDAMGNAIGNLIADRVAASSVANAPQANGDGSDAIGPVGRQPIALEAIPLALDDMTFASYGSANGGSYDAEMAAELAALARAQGRVASATAALTDLREASRGESASNGGYRVDAQGHLEIDIVGGRGAAPSTDQLENQITGTIRGLSTWETLTTFPLQTTSGWLADGATWLGNAAETMRGKSPTTNSMWPNNVNDREVTDYLSPNVISGYVLAGLADAGAGALSFGRTVIDREARNEFINGVLKAPSSFKEWWGTSTGMEKLDAAYSVVTGGVIPAGGIVGKLGRVGGRVVPGSGKTVTLYRVDDTGYAPRIAPDGSVPVVATKAGNERALFVNIGQPERAKEFALVNRSENAIVTAVEVDASLLERLRATSIYDRSPDVSLYPNAPLRVDINKAPDQFGLRTPEHFDWLREAIKPNSVRVIDPKDL